MTFYIDTTSTLTLNNDEEDLLLQIDSFKSCSTTKLHLSNTIGDIHQHVPVVLSKETKQRQYCYSISADEREKTLFDIRQQILTIKKDIETQCSKLLQQADSDAEWRRNKPQSPSFLDILGHTHNQLKMQENLYENATQLPSGDFEISGKIDILGEYDSKNERIIIYLDTIRKKTNSEWSLAMVYVHESMHAFYNTKTHYIPEIEEPIVEYSTLAFFEQFGDDKLISYIEKEIHKKSDCPGIAFYGFGYYLYKNSKGIDWMLEYESCKTVLPNDKSDCYVKLWSNGLYPCTKEERTLDALYFALHPKSRSISKTGYSPINTTGSKPRIRYYILNKGILCGDAIVGEDRLVREFVKRYSVEESLPSFSNISMIFNHNPDIGTIVYDSLPPIRNASIDINGSIYYVKSGIWHKNREFTRFCKMINNDTIGAFKNYTIVADATDMLKHINP